MRNERSQSFACKDGETWYEHKGYEIRLERRGPSLAFEVFKDGMEQVTGIESDNEDAVFRMLSNRLK
jgi:hypothetical protein